MMPDTERIREHVVPLTKNPSFLELFNDIGERRFVLLGEATHGTDEFYSIRAKLSQELIQKKDLMPL
jgi:erythromycin esterase-like protein